MPRDATETHRKQAQQRIMSLRRRRESMLACLDLFGGHWLPLPLSLLWTWPAYRPMLHPQGQTFCV